LRGDTIIYGLDFHCEPTHLIRLEHELKKRGSLHRKQRVGPATLQRSVSAAGGQRFNGFADP
jgi:hypothetical protein